MHRIRVIRKAQEKAERTRNSYNKKGYKESKADRDNLTLFQNRLKELEILEFLLNIRPTIEKITQDNYNKDNHLKIILETVFFEVGFNEKMRSYTMYGEVETELTWVTKEQVEPFIASYIQKVIKKIENQTLKLEL